MKKLLLCLALLSACSSKQEEVAQVAQVTQLSNVQLPAAKQRIKDIDYSVIEPRIAGDVQKLDSICGYTPYYTTVEGQTYYVVAWGEVEKERYNALFAGALKYGIVAATGLQPLLPVEYDKIYNFSATALGCVEVKQGNKTGLFHLGRKELLLPQFDYIMPSAATPSTTAFGLQNGQWMQIETANAFAVQAAPQFSPAALLQSLNFNLEKAKGNCFFGTYHDVKNVGEMGESGKGVLLLPSYLENWGARNYFEDVVMANQKDAMGVYEMNLKAVSNQSISEKIKGFFVTFFERGIGGRDYTNESTTLLAYNEANRQINAFTFKELSPTQSPCPGSHTKFLNDTLLEVMASVAKYEYEQNHYEYQTSYFYYSVSKDGRIAPLKTNRYYNFTKFAQLEPRHFKGCFGKRLTDEYIPESNEGNILMRDHFTIAELDTMRNEIYADYGYIFKEEGWKAYFSQFPWYKPTSTDIKLSEQDKKNVEAISNMKKQMEGKEQEFTKERRVTFYEAG